MVVAPAPYPQPFPPCDLKSHAGIRTLLGVDKAMVRVFLIGFETENTYWTVDVLPALERFRFPRDSKRYPIHRVASCIRAFRGS